MPQRVGRRDWGRRVFQTIVLGVTLGGSAAAGAEVRMPSPYAPYAFLIGQWDVAPEGGGAPVASTLFRFGPKESYIWFAVSELVEGAERPHLEGLLVWNGVHKNLDMLLAVGLDGAGFEEQGVLFVEPDGTVVREITAVYSEGDRPIGRSVVGPGGATARFRQTFKAVGPNRVLTRVLREGEKGWVATFPGSDRLVMTRREKV